MAKEGSNSSAIDRRSAENTAEIASSGRSESSAAAERCAAALADCVNDKERPVMAIGSCPSSLSSALQQHGFSRIDGYASEAGAVEEAQSSCRALEPLDLSEPLPMPVGAYTHAAAAACLEAEEAAPTLLDEVLKKLPRGGCFAFSLGQPPADPALIGRIMELTDSGFADLLCRHSCAQMPGSGEAETVYVLRRR